MLQINKCPILGCGMDLVEDIYNNVYVCDACIFTISFKKFNKLKNRNRLL